MWDALVCPFDHRQLAVSQWRWLTCTHCGRGYPVLDGIPRIVPPENHAGWVHRVNVWAQRAARNPFAAGVRLNDEQRGCLRQRARRWESVLRETFSWGYDSQALQISVSGELLVHHFQWGNRFAVNPLAGFLADQGLLRWGRVRWVHAQGEWLPFASGSFDLVLLDGALQWCESPRRLLKQAARCLKPQGVLGLVWPSGRADASRPGAFPAGQSGLPGPLQLRRPSPQRVDRWLEQAGLRVFWPARPRTRTSSSPIPGGTFWLCAATPTAAACFPGRFDSLPVSF